MVILGKIAFLFSELQRLYIGFEFKLKGRIVLTALERL